MPLLARGTSAASRASRAFLMQGQIVGRREFHDYGEGWPLGAVQLDYLDAHGSCRDRPLQQMPLPLVGGDKDQIINAALLGRYHVHRFLLNGRLRQGYGKVKD